MNECTCPYPLLSSSDHQPTCQHYRVEIDRYFCDCGHRLDRHGPEAAEREWAGRRMDHDEIAEIAFEVIRTCHERGISDPLRLAHAVAVAVKLADLTAR